MLNLKKIMPRSSRATVSLASFAGGMDGSVDQNLLPIKYAREIQNLGTCGGALRPGIGISALQIPSLSNAAQALLSAQLEALGNVRFVVQYKRLDENGNRADFLIALSGTNLVAIDLFHPQNPSKTIYTTMTEIPTAVNYNLDSQDVIIFSTTTGPMLVWNGVDEITEIADAPPISSMVVHYERLFATSSGTEQNSVWFSDDLDPTNWTLSLAEAGFVQMVDERGAACRVLSFLDYVFVFREYGIARISGYGDQTQFLVSQLTTSSGKIFPGTVTLCGDEVLFLAEDGIYVFGGLSTTRILPGLAPFFAGADNHNATACAGDGKWYLSANIFLENASGDMVETPVLMEYDLVTKTVILSVGLDVDYLTTLRLPTGSKVLVVTKRADATAKVAQLDHSGACFGTSLSGVWKSAWTDLGRSDAHKIIRKISFVSSGEVTLTIDTDTTSQTIKVSSKTETAHTRRLLASGSRMRLKIETPSSTANVSNVKISMELKTK